MNAYLTRARAFWAGRTLRERVFLAAGGIVLGLGIGYGLVVDPLLKADAKLAANLPRLRAELRQMRPQVDEIERLRSGGGAAAKTGSALVHAIESAAAAQGVRQALTSLAPQGADRVRVTTGPIALAAWLAWFGDLERNGIAVVSCHLATGEKPGLVSVEAVLGGGGR